MLGPFKKLKYREESRKKTCIFFVENIQRFQFFLVKLIGQWILNRKGRGIAKNIWKNYLNFQTLKIIVTKLRQFKKLKCREGSKLFKIVPTLLLFFVEFENENIFPNIPSYPLPFAVQKSLTNQFYQKIGISQYFQQKK